jgi:hypothetical protein
MEKCMDVQRMKIACHCNWASGSKKMLIGCVDVDTTMNQDIPDADLVVDIGDLFTSASSKYPPQKRAHASTEPSVFMGYGDGSLAARMADYYKGFVFTWHPQLLHLSQRRRFHFGLSWVTWPPKSKKLGIGAVFSGKANPNGEGYALRRRLIDETERSISVPGMIYSPKGSWKGTEFQYPLPSKRPSLEYMFHISIENHSEDGYFTEKLMDPIIDGCVPIYYGDPQIDKVFDMRGIIQLDQKDMAGQINGLTEKDFWDRKPFMEENKKRAERFLDTRIQIVETAVREMMV